MNARLMTFVCLGLALCLANRGSAGVPSLAELLSRPILPAETPQKEALQYARPRVKPLPDFQKLEDWQKYATAKRSELLEKVIYRGVPATWTEGPVSYELLDFIPGGPGYRLRKLRYQALPGLWIPALLYLPENVSGKVPVFLNVNGHDGNGKQAPYKQMRCINLAKRGIIALNVEWYNMGQLQAPGYAHGRLNQLDLCGVSGLAPFYLNMKRALDLLLSLEHADPTRVGVAGLSGGGWQTIFISALDTRVTLANPVAGYGSLATRLVTMSDLGDSEQAPVDFSTMADYTHLTALLAPRPALLTYNSKDQCCFKSATTLPPLMDAAQPVYKLYGQERNLTFHINDVPGTHNFLQENREALYGLVGRHFFPTDRSYSAAEIPSDKEEKTAVELNVPLPANNATFHLLALEMARTLPLQASIPPRGTTEFREWQARQRKELSAILHYKVLTASGKVVNVPQLETRTVKYWHLRCGGDWSVPVVEISQGVPTSTVLLLGDAGRSKLDAEVQQSLSRGARVLLMDPWYFGENFPKDRSYLYALVLSTVGERPLGIQAAQLAAVSKWIQQTYSHSPKVVSYGPRTGLIVSVALALEPSVVSASELNQAHPSLKTFLEQDLSFEQVPEVFCFGLLRHFDMPQLAALRE